MTNAIAQELQNIILKSAEILAQLENNIETKQAQEQEQILNTQKHIQQLIKERDSLITLFFENNEKKAIEKHPDLIYSLLEPLHKVEIISISPSLHNIV